MFIENELLLGEALSSGAGAVLVPFSVGPGNYAKPLLRVKHPKLAFARAARLLANRRPVEIHPSAIIGHALIGEETAIGAGCVLADNVSIGTGCTLYRG